MPTRAYPPAHCARPPAQAISHGTGLMPVITRPSSITRPIRRTPQKRTPSSLPRPAASSTAEPQSMPPGGSTPTPPPPGSAAAPIGPQPSPPKPSAARTAGPRPHKASGPIMPRLAQPSQHVEQRHRRTRPYAAPPSHVTATHRSPDRQSVSATPAQASHRSSPTGCDGHARSAPDTAAISQPTLPAPPASGPAASAKTPAASAPRETHPPRPRSASQPCRWPGHASPARVRGRQPGLHTHPG